MDLYLTGRTSPTKLGVGSKDSAIWSWKLAEGLLSILSNRSLACKQFKVKPVTQFDKQMCIRENNMLYFNVWNQ